MNKRTMKKGLAIVLALVMVFAMTATAFAETNSNITVTVKFDTRTLSRSNAVLSTSSGVTVGNTPVTTVTVTLEQGKSVRDALNAAAGQLGMTIETEASPFYAGSYVTDIGGIGQQNFIGNAAYDTSGLFTGYTYLHNGLQSLFANKAAAQEYLTYYENTLWSGWVYNVDGMYPVDKTMDDYALQSNCTVAFRYTVSAYHDVTNEVYNLQPPYVNYDLQFIDAYEQLLAVASPNQDQQDILDAVDVEMASYENNTLGWTAPFYSNATLSGYTEMIEAVL